MRWQVEERLRGRVTLKDGSHFSTPPPASKRPRDEAEVQRQQAEKKRANDRFVQSANRGGDAMQQAQAALNRGRGGS